MIPTVTEATIENVNVQDDRLDIAEAIKSHIAFAEENQEVLMNTMAGSIHRVFDRYGDDIELLKRLTYGILSTAVKCIYTQADINELEEMFNG